MENPPYVRSDRYRTVVQNKGRIVADIVIVVGLIAGTGTVVAISLTLLGIALGKIKV